MNSYGEVDGVSIEPLPIHEDNAVEHYDAAGRGCISRCKAEAGKLVIKSAGSKLVTI